MLKSSIGRRYQRRRSMLRVGLAVLLGCVPVVAAQPAASASSACSSSQGSRFDGFAHNPYTHPSYQFEGASAYIVVQTGNVCSGITNIGNFSNAWVMIAAPTGNAWAQVGFEHTSGFSLRWFAQFNDDHGHIATRYSNFSVNSEIGVRHTFRVLWSGDCICEKATIDTTTWLVSTFNPFYEWSPEPWSPQFAGEVGYLEADMPGYSANHTKFTALGAPSSTPTMRWWACPAR
ncbi:MAG: hypothetical protein ACR2KJ_12230 [Jatrophihabitans sp.]